MAQNTSHAVMQQRREALDSLEDFPTPPWSTRALIKHVIKPLMSKRDISGDTVWEPSCNRGYMTRVLSEEFCTVYASDIVRYENWEPWFVEQDFLDDTRTCMPIARGVDWIITNPPFNKAEAFIARCAQIQPTAGYAMLVRSAFLEGVGRYERIFSSNPPNVVAQFSERVPMVKGRYDQKASTATSYCWLVWFSHWRACESMLMWIPPCRKELEKETDV